MTEPTMNPKQNRERMAQIHFEKFGFGRIQVGIQALLPLFAEVLRSLNVRVCKQPCYSTLAMASRTVFPSSRASSCSTTHCG